MLELQNVGKRISGKVILDDITLTLDDDNIVILLGPNGAGKTTLIKLLAGIYRPTCGEICLDGEMIDVVLRKHKEHIAFMPEEFSLYPEMTVREYLTFMVSLYDLKNTTARVERLLDDFNLTDIKNKLASTLSKGYAKRVALASVFVAEPQMLLLDEPFSGMDIDEKETFTRFLKERAAGRLVIISSHVLEDIETMWDRVVVMSDGRVVGDECRAGAAVFTITAEGDKTAIITQVKCFPGVLSVDAHLSADATILTVITERGFDDVRGLEALFGGEAVEVKETSQRLREVYMKSIAGLSGGGKTG